jgi:hypothetical protein
MDKSYNNEGYWGMYWKYRQLKKENDFIQEKVIGLTGQHLSQEKVLQVIKEIEDWKEDQEHIRLMKLKLKMGMIKPEEMKHCPLCGAKSGKLAGHRGRHLKKPQE